MERVCEQQIVNQPIIGTLQNLGHLILKFVVQFVRLILTFTIKSLVYIYKICVALLLRFHKYWKSEHAHEQRTHLLEWSIDAGQTCWNALQWSFIKLGSLSVLCWHLLLKSLRNALRYMLIVVLWTISTVATGSLKLHESFINFLRKTKCNIYKMRKRGIRSTLDIYQQKLNKIVDNRVSEDNEKSQFTNIPTEEPSIIEENDTNTGGFIGYIGRTLIRFVDTITNKL